MRKPSPAMLVALISLFVALGGVGIAANGDSLILGQSNSATSQTALSAPVAGGKTLQLTNNDTATGNSTALGLNVANGHPPFTVNSGGKVNNLNADKVDGLEAAAFVPRSDGVSISADVPFGTSKRWDIGPYISFIAECYYIFDGSTGHFDQYILDNSPQAGSWHEGELLFKTANPGIVIDNLGYIGSGLRGRVSHEERPSSGALNGEAVDTMLTWHDGTGEGITGIYSARVGLFLYSPCSIQANFMRVA